MSVCLAACLIAPVSHPHDSHGLLLSGPTDAKKLSDFLTIEALKTSALVFTKIKQWTKKKDEGSLKGMKEHAEKHRASLSEQQSAEYKRAFDFFDAGAARCNL